MSVEKTEIETFFGRCRCCLSYGYLKNMWSEHDFEGQTEIYGEMLVQCFALSLDPSENTMDQDQICEQCICRLRDASDFKKVVLESQEELLHNFNEDNAHFIKEEMLEVQYLHDDTADTTYADTEYTADTADTGGNVKEEMEYQEIEYLEDEVMDDDTKDTGDTDSSQPSEPKPKRRQALRSCRREKSQDEEGEPKRKWPKKLPKAERLKTYKQYSEEMFRKCMGDVRSGHMTPQEASEKYNVPKKTICAKLRLDPIDVLIDNTTVTEWLKPIKSKLRSRSTISTREVAVDNVAKQYTEPKKEREATEKQPLKTKEDDDKPEYNDIYKHKNNMRAVLKHSNATIIRVAGKNGYSCNFCNEQSETPRELKLHNIIAHARQAEEAVKTKLMSDLVIKLDITGLKCKLCHQFIDTLENFMLHLSEVHAILIYTDIKNYMVPFKFDTDEFKCVKCSKTFNYFPILAEHMCEHYRYFKCSMCDRGFITKQLLQTHSYKHKGGVFKCPSCPKVFDTQHKRHEHVKSQHVTPSTYRKCAYCDERFPTWNLLVNHELKTHGVKPKKLSCDECGKTCITQSSLTHHKNHFHLQQRPHKCPQCVKTFLSTTDLHAHLKTHTKPKGYTCNICEKVFVSQASLTRHTRSHLNVQKYLCDYCDREFLDKNYFKTHMLKRHGEIV